MTTSGAASKMMSSVDPIQPDALLDDVAPPLRAIAQRLRRIVRAASPDAIERVRPRWRLIGYDLPVGKRTVYFAWVWPEHEHVHLGFQHGWAMRDAGNMLHGRGVTKRVRWLTFTSSDAIDEAIRVATMSRGEREIRAMHGEADPPERDAP